MVRKKERQKERNYTAIRWCLYCELSTQQWCDVVGDIITGNWFFVNLAGRILLDLICSMKTGLHSTWYKKKGAQKKNTKEEKKKKKKKKQKKKE